MYHQAVNDHFYRMFFLFVQVDLVAQIVNSAIHAHTHIPRAPHLLKNMVSKDRLLLPAPERPVMTTSLSRGIDTSLFFRLCSRAPRITILSWGIQLNHPFPQVQRRELPAVTCGLLFFDTNVRYALLYY